MWCADAAQVHNMPYLDVTTRTDFPCLGYFPDGIMNPARVLAVNPGPTLDERFCSAAVPMAAIWTEALHIS